MLEGPYGLAVSILGLNHLFYLILLGCRHAARSILLRSQHGRRCWRECVTPASLSAAFES